MTTYTSMGDGVQMGTCRRKRGAHGRSPESDVALRFHGCLGGGYYDSIIHVSPEGKRLGNENNIHAAADMAKETGFL